MTSTLFCDLNRDRLCNETDKNFFDSSFGKCRGQAGYIFNADIDGDGCVVSIDEANFYHSLSEFDSSQMENTPTSYPVPTLKEGLKRYLNRDLRFGFDYPDNLKIRECPNLGCVSIDELTFRLFPMGDFIYTVGLEVNCLASGPGSEEFCQDFRSEAYENLHQFQGVKITYIKNEVTSVSGSNTYQAVAYGFPLSSRNKNNDYQAILLMVDTPIQTNLTALAIIADSFFTY